MLSMPVNFILVVAGFGVSIALSIWEIVDAWKARLKLFKGEDRADKVRAYMTKLLSGDGRCVVSSHDLSWAKGEARDALERKAEDGSLELVMPRATDFSDHLVSKGAVAHYYGDDSTFRFRSRFTIVNSSRQDAYLAVGMGTEKAHTIRVVKSNEDPAFHMATDLIALAERVARR